MEFCAGVLASSGRAACADGDADPGEVLRLDAKAEGESEAIPPPRDRQLGVLVGLMVLGPCATLRSGMARAS